MGSMLLNFPYEDLNYIEVDGIKNIFNTRIFNKKYLNIVDNKISTSGVFLLIDNSLYGKKRIFVCQSNNVKKCIEEYNIKINERRIDWNYDLVVAFLNVDFKKEMRLVLGKLLADFYLNEKKYIVEMEHGIKNKKTYEPNNDINESLINDALKEIDLFFKTFSFFNLDLCLYTNLNKETKNNIDEEVNKVYNGKNKIIKKIEENNIFHNELLNDYLFIRPDEIKEEKIAGWIYGDEININSKNLKEVVCSLFTFLYKNNKQMFENYIKENQNDCKYPILIKEEDYKKMDTQKAYSYEKMKDYNIYIFSRMSSKFLIRHIISLINYLKLSKLDFYFLIKK